MHFFKTLTLSALLLSGPALAVDDGSTRAPQSAATSAASCSQTFSSSSAGQTCILRHASFRNGVCTIEALCGRGESPAIGATYTGPINRVSGLHNCLGVLKYGGC